MCNGALTGSQESKKEDKNETLCKTFVWTDEGVGDFRPSNEPSAIDEISRLPSMKQFNVNGLKILSDVVLLSNKNDVIAFTKNVGKQNPYTENHINCSAADLIDSFLRISINEDLKMLSIDVLCILRVPPTNDPISKGSRLQLKKQNILVLKFTESLLKAVQETKEDSLDWRTNPEEMRRIQFLLKDLKFEMVKRREKYILLMQNLLNEISSKLERLPAGAPTNGDIDSDFVSVHKVIIEAANASVKAVVLNDVEHQSVNSKSPLFAQIVSMTDILKDIRSQIAANRQKRSVNRDLNYETVQVRNLILKNFSMNIGIQS